MRCTLKFETKKTHSLKFLIIAILVVLTIILFKVVIVLTVLADLSYNQIFFMACGSCAYPIYLAITGEKVEIKIEGNIVTYNDGRMTRAIFPLNSVTQVSESCGKSNPYILISTDEDLKFKIPMKGFSLKEKSNIIHELSPT